MLGVIVTLGCGFALGGVSSLEIDKLILNVMNLSSMVPREATSPCFYSDLVDGMVCHSNDHVASAAYFTIHQTDWKFFSHGCIFVSVAYFMKPFFFGNYAMMIRNALLCEGGVDAAEGILILSLVSLASIVGAASFTTARIF